MTKQEILNLSHDDFAKWLETIGEKPFRAAQVFEWIYKKGVTSFDEMKNLPDDLREKLSEYFIVGEGLNPSPTKAKQISSDGTIKFLFSLVDNEKIETVLIPTDRRVTVCVSTQSGCKFGCKFCASGIGGFKRNLTVSEIIYQLIVALKYSPLKKISNVVFMGIGEPLDNYDNLFKAIRIINSKEAFCVGARKITVSTCGLIDKINKMANEKMQIELAVSLHGYDQESRSKLMPVNNKYKFDDLIKTCRDYYRKTKRQITFEYILIKDFTCSKIAAEKLSKALKGFDCKLNLIYYNNVSEFGYVRPANNQIKEFQQQLDRLSIYSVLRTPRGEDIAAACGQLRNQSNK